MFWAFVVNPVAGTGYAEQVMDQLEKRLDGQKIPYRIFKTQEQGHGKRIAEELSENPDVIAVVAVGGDGTAGEIAAGLCGTGKPMGIIPAGTGNDFIKSAGIPKDPVQAFEFIFSHKPRPTDTGTVNNEFFLNVCGTGFDVTVLDYAEGEKQKHRGLTPYFLGLLKAIAHYKSVHLKVTADTVSSDGKYLVCSIANGRFIGGGIPICPKADIEDGFLDLVLIRNRHRWQIPFYLPGLMLSRDLSFRITTHRRVSDVVIEGNQLRINIDGDIKSVSKAEFILSSPIFHI